tara:strand:- start:832 stop:1956 length:1125 start_codon:yes stop_codon:yes gene_type:complete
MVQPGPTSGLLTSLNSGSYANTGGTGERVLIDYKDAIIDYKVTDLPVMQFFADPMTTDTGGNIDITFAKPSMTMEQIEEGTTPQYQHTKLRSERVAVKEWGIAVGVTRRMIEDSRFNEVEMALNEARRAVDRHLTEHVTNVIFGIGSTTLGTGVDVGAGFTDILAAGAASTEANISDFSKAPNGAFLGTAATFAGRLDEYANQSLATLQACSSYTAASSNGTSSFALVDVAAAISRMSKLGYNATHLFISPSHYENMLKMADFVSAFTNAQGTNGSIQGGGNFMPTTGDNPFSSMLATGGLVGSLYGLAVIVNPWVPAGRFGVFDLSVKPMAYVERRGLTVEEANPGFGIVGSYMSMRYGLKVVRPEAGQIVIS